MFHVTVSHPSSRQRQPQRPYPGRRGYATNDCRNRAYYQPYYDYCADQYWRQGQYYQPYYDYYSDLHRRHGQPLPRHPLTQQHQRASQPQRSPKSLESPAISPTQPSEPEMSTSSSSSSTSTNEPEPILHLPTTRLLPACGNFHNLTRGKNIFSTAAIGAYGPLRSTTCPSKNAAACTHGRLVGSSENGIQTTRRFPRESSLDELQAWLHDPHTTLPNGHETYERDGALLARPDVCVADLLALLGLAIEMVRLLHAEIEGLVQYAARPPYCLKFGNAEVAEQADLEVLDWRVEDFERVPRWGLEGDVLRAAEEVDYLRDCCEVVRERIGVVVEGKSER